MPDVNELPQTFVPREIVDATLRIAEERGVPAADVTLRDIAVEAGISRSTLLRRLGGTRQALDEALRAAGVEPGRSRPVRERAIDAAADLISKQGLATLTFERVAVAAECSVPSLYVAFGGRDELMRAVFERYSPILDVEAFLAGPRGDLEDTVRRFHRLLADALEREPRVLPALLAEVFARPGDAHVQRVFRNVTPRLLAGLGSWLAEEVAVGRIRDLPLVLLTQQMTSPILLHFLLRPVTSGVSAADLPTRDETLETFTQAFLRAVSVPSSQSGE
ncbi:TetR/AcrR family transcriptional regulator [Streptomyces longwoodensis]|uniref:TetR/AcrR family transcriptional regulator n=1 Tax=Streptomyces longwoodensis TaxID=68231 RepID=UPI0033CC6D6E